MSISGYAVAGRAASVTTSAGTTTIGYDFESRAASISGPGISQSITYNGLDTRVSSTTNSVSNTFLRDGAYVTDPVVKDSNATYTPGLYERRSGSTRQLHHNLKSVEAQTTLTPAVSASRTYDGFGNVLSSTGTHLGPFGYGGGFGYQEDATGLQLLGHRLYDSSTGRFLTRDPIQHGRNWYIYCEGDPMGLIDPEGLKPGDKYKSADAATKAAALENQGRSEKDDRELGGWIYKNDDGTYSYTLKGGNKESVNPGPRPVGGVGSWHTHPTPKGVPGYVHPDTASGGDRDFIDYYGGTHYISSQTGIIWKYENGVGKPIGRTKPAPKPKPRGNKGNPSGPKPKK